MNSLRYALSILILSVFSIQLGAQTAVELEWTDTNGTGSPGSNSIVAKVSDRLTLDIIVKDKSVAGIGLMGAALSLSYDPNYLAPLSEQECPNPPNISKEICSDAIGTVFLPYLPGTFTNAGNIYNFDAYSEKNKPGYFNDSGDEMVLGRVIFKVTSQGNSSVEVFYDAVGGESIVDGNNVVWQPDATAKILPPPGC